MRLIRTFFQAFMETFRDFRREDQNAEWHQRAGCTEKRHRGEGARFVGVCVDCGKPTCEWTLRVDQRSLRRRKHYECRSCKVVSWGRIDGGNSARDRRREKDWSMLTDPLRMDLINTGVLPEQYPSHVRAILRAFYVSGEETAEVPDLTPSTATDSIARLGLDEVMYAEQRGRQTILRRIM